MTNVNDGGGTSPPEKLLNWNFVLLWQGQFVSFIGTQAFLISMIFWMKHETGSATWVGLVTMASTLPGALLGPLGGAIADRYSRRGIILMTDFIRGALSLGLAGLVYVYSDQPKVVLVGLLSTAFLMGALGSFFRPALLASIPDLVPPDKVTAGNSLLGVSINVSTFLGQAVGGVLFRLLGPVLLFVFNGVSYIFSGISELFIKIPQKLPESNPSWRKVLASVRQETLEGLRYIWAERGLTMLLVAAVADMVFMVAIAVLFPFFVEDHLEASPDWYGYLVATFAVGNALGAIVAGVLKVGGRRRVAMIVVAGTVASISGMILGHIHSGWHALILILVAGTFVGFNGIHVLTAIQLASSNEIRARVLGLFGTISLAATPIAAGLSGVVTDLLKQDIGTVYTLCGLGLGLTPLIVLLSARTRVLLAYEKHQETIAQPDVSAVAREQEERKMKRVVRWVAVGAVVLLSVLLATVVYMVRRPWPQVEGRLEVAGLRAPVEVIRDDWGVPHVYAENEHDLFFAQGYVHAQDRLWQMHMVRTLGSGRLASLFGRGAVETDRLFRILSLRHAAREDWERLDDELRAILEAYSAGVNAYVEANRGHVGLEFRLLAVEPEPWTGVDTLTWTKMLSLNIGLNMSREIARVHLRSRLGDELGVEAAERILARYPDDGPVIVSPAPPGVATPAAEEGALEEEREARLGSPDRVAALGLPAVRDRLAQWLVPDGLLPDVRRLSPFLGTTPSWGSNAWVVHGSRTASGKPLLANDPHLGLALPSVWYENGLHGGRFDVVGFSFPGLPMVVTGHNGHVAWGITSLATDTQDLFVEELDEVESPARYRFQEGWRDLETRIETIEVKGGDDVELVIHSTHHGPIVNEAFETIRDEPPMALSWIALGEVRLLRALVELDQATGWDEFRSALSYWDAPALSFVYADVLGNIGYQATGRHPIRGAGHDGSVPVPGWTGEHDWVSFIPAAELPWSYNPPSGVVVTANNKTVSDDYAYELTTDWPDPSRAQRISDLLAEGDDFTAEDMARIQGDTFSVLAEKIRPYLLVVDPGDALEKRALEEVRKWDLRYESDRVGAAVFYVWQWQLFRHVVADELGDDEKLDQDTAVVFQQHSTLDELIARADDPWFDDRTTPQVETRRDMVRRSLSSAVAWLVENHGEDPALWRWGKLHPMVFTHQPLGQTGQSMVDGLFNSDPMEGRGGPFTVFATFPSVTQPFAVVGGVSHRFIADLSDLSRSKAINSTGQSIHLFHRHREDQILLWQEVGYRPVRFSRGSVEAAAKGTLYLTPP